MCASPSGANPHAAAPGVSEPTTGTTPAPSASLTTTSLTTTSLTSASPRAAKSPAARKKRRAPKSELGNLRDFMGDAKLSEHEIAEITRAAVEAARAVIERFEANHEPVSSPATRAESMWAL